MMIENFYDFKPVELVDNAILNSTRHGMNVLDIYSGSGTTMISSEKNRRKCFAMEIEPKYCDVIVSRWCKFTGKNKVKLNGVEITWDIS